MPWQRKLLGTSPPSLRFRARSRSPHPSDPAVPTMEFHSVDDPIATFNGTSNQNPRSGSRSWMASING